MKGSVKPSAGSLWGPDSSLGLLGVSSLLPLASKNADGPRHLVSQQFLSLPHQEAPSWLPESRNLVSQVLSTPARPAPTALSIVTS